MAGLVYVETNLLVGMALGREPRVAELLAALSPAFQVAIPSACFMEAFSALEDERGRRNVFRDSMTREVKELQRDMTSPHARNLMTHAREAALASDRLMTDIQSRLFDFVAQAGRVFQHLETTPQTLLESIHSFLIRDPTDNLILHVILDHARRSPEPEKALLTGNFDTPRWTRQVQG